MPLTALALLATVFLFTTERSIPGGLTFSEADLDSLETGMHITRPRFSGSSENGDVYNFSADLLLPDAPKPETIKAVGLSGQIVFLQGTTMQLNAEEATFTLKDKTLLLSQGMSTVLSDGFRAEAESMYVDLDTGHLTTNGPVRATSPMGNIEAGNLRVENELIQNEENRMIWFEDGVKLIVKLDEL